MLFFVRQKVRIASKNFATNPKFRPFFRHLKMRSFQQCITVTAVNLFREVLPKEFKAFGFYFFQGKTGDG